jgi:hypothetical protein
VAVRCMKNFEDVARPTPVLKGAGVGSPPCDVTVSSEPGKGTVFTVRLLSGANNPPKPKPTILWEALARGRW